MPITFCFVNGLLRRLTLTLLQAHPAKLSVAKKRYAAALDPDFSRGNPPRRRHPGEDVMRGPCQMYELVLELRALVFHDEEGNPWDAEKRLGEEVISQVRALLTRYRLAPGA